MRIPIGTAVTALVTKEVPFACSRCGARFQARVSTYGHGVASFINEEGTAEARSAVDAEREVDRVLRRARCPACGRRERRAHASFLMPYAGTLFATTIVGIAVGYGPRYLDLVMKPSDRATLALYVPVAVFGLTLLAATVHALLRWNRTDAQIAWFTEDASRAIQVPMPKMAGRAAFALLGFVLVMGSIVALRHQTFSQAMTMVCDAPHHLDPDLDPANRAMKLAAWIDSRLTNDEVRELFKRMPPDRDAATKRAQDAVRRAGIEQCWMLDP